MIIKESALKIEGSDFPYSLDVNGRIDLFKNSVFFDLEHYVYKKPVCIGVFGAGYYDEESNELKITQYMMENKHELEKILNLSKQYFVDMQEKFGKKYVVTFSGNNDFIVIDYLLKKYKFNYILGDYFEGIDLQKKYEQVKKKSIGLKALEGEFHINRESEIISGSTLAKTFGKIMKDDSYFSRMPDEKKEKILLYNMQDVASLFHIYTNWNKFITDEE